MRQFFLMVRVLIKSFLFFGLVACTPSNNCNDIEKNIADKWVFIDMQIDGVSSYEDYSSTPDIFTFFESGSFETTKTGNGKWKLINDCSTLQLDYTSSEVINLEIEEVNENKLVLRNITDTIRGIKTFFIRGTDDNLEKMREGIKEMEEREKGNQ